MRLRRRFILYKILTLLSIFLILFLHYFKSNEITSNITISQKLQLNNDSKCEVINIGVMVDYDHVLHFYTMLKSLYYFRNNPLHLHIAVDDLSGKIVKRLFETWTVPQVNVSFYDVSTFEYDFRMPKYHNYYRSSSLKFLLLKRISTNIANKLIVIDPDILFNSDIRNLWNEFDNFSETQIMGFLKYQNDAETENKEEFNAGHEEEQEIYNLNVMLLNLDSLKITKHLWFQIINHFDRTSITKQNILHTIIDKYQHLVYCISSWNWQRINNSRYYNNSQMKILSFSALNSTNNYMQIYNMLNSYNGSLLRNQKYKCMEKSENPSVTVKTKIDNCSDFHEVQNHQWRTLLFIRKFNYNATEDDLTFVSQLSYSRREVLEDLGQFWEGPMSVTVYVTDSQLHDFINFITKSENLQNRSDIAYHAVFKDGDNHPINVLRNVALRHVTTPYVFLVDIDFIPMPHLYLTLKNYISKTKYMENQALIVPAFETKATIPKTKNKLLEMMNDGIVFQFHHFVYRKAHAPTNYQKWRVANNSYPVLWKPNFEPYVVVARNVTEYDERFFGYGWNKVSHIMELKAQGYRFIVLPNVFIVHKSHKFSNDRHKFIRSRRQQSCLQKLKSKFMKEIKTKYANKRVKEEH